MHFTLRALRESINYINNNKKYNYHFLWKSILSK